MSAFQPGPCQSGTITSRKCCCTEANNAVKPESVTAKRENFATRNANGTGPFRLVSREPDVKTVAEPNPTWWDKAAHNITKVTFTPIASDATRVAALLSGQVDWADPIPVQDMKRIGQLADAARSYAEVAQRVIATTAASARLAVAANRAIRGPLASISIPARLAPID